MRMKNTPDAGNFRITRNSSSGPLEVQIALDPASTATPASDFSLVGVMLAGGAGAVTIPDGSDFIDIALNPIDDIPAEADETATLEITPTPGYTVGASASATVTIAANDFVVTNTNDFVPGPGATGQEGTLRQALRNANDIAGNDTVSFSDGTGGTVNFGDGMPRAISLSGSPLRIRSALTLTGPGADQLTISGNSNGDATVDPGESSVITVDDMTMGAPPVVSISGLTIADGIRNTGPGMAGGGIFNREALVLDFVRITNCRAVGDGGGISSSGPLTITNSCIDGNTTDTGDGGGIDMRNGTISNTTISGNTAATQLPGNVSEGGGLQVNATTGVNLLQVTITGNTADASGGVNANIGAVDVVNSIIAGNTANDSDDDVGIDVGFFGANPQNFIGDPAGIAAFAGATTFATPPGYTIAEVLDTTLTNNGGPTPTHALIAGSPAIDAGDNMPVAALPNDQRGPGFDRIFNTTVDLGAFELDADITPPMITCPPDLTVECSDPVDPSNTGVATATDDRDPNPVITFIDSTVPGVGANSTITRTWTATDAAGNSASCDQVITVVDTTAPMITCPVQVWVECPFPTDPSITGSATATDNCDPDPVISFNDVETPGVGANKTIARTWTATDANGNSVSCVQTINVEDTTPPMISCPAGAMVECDSPTDPSSTGSATATDSCDPNPVISFNDVETPGVGANKTIARTWTATDANGNSASCVQTITVVDTTAPMITCPPDVTIEWDQPTDPSNTGSATAADNCDPNPVISFNDMETPAVLGDYSIARTWTATDANGNSSICVQTITVENAPPMVDAANPSVSVNEGSEATNTGSFSDTPADTVTITADIGMITMQDAGASGTWSWSYTPEDGPVMETVTITATDSFMKQTTTTFDLDVDNVDPVVILDPVTAIDENGTATLTGTITDPGVLDTFTLEINWGDPLSPDNVESFNIAANATGTQSISITHRYLDDNPTNTAFDTYVVSATIEDSDMGAGMAGSSVLVRNVAPTVELDPVSDIDENGLITLSGTVTDPGTLDTFTLDIDWGDPLSPGNIQQIMLPPSPGGSQTFMLSHQYLDDNPTGTARDDFTVQVTVTDDDDLSGSDSESFMISNVPPELTLDPVVSIDENGLATLTGTITDPGTLDTFSLFVDWGDPVNPNNFENFTIGSDASGTQTFIFTHQYLDDNPSGTPLDSKTIFAVLLDDEGASDSALTGVQINNVAPDITGLVATPGPGGVTIDVDFTDPGTLDTHAVQILWGDGMSTPLTLPVGDRSFQASHSYAMEPPPGGYPITVIVSDDDTGSDSETTGPPAPPAGPSEIDMVERLANGDIQFGFAATPGEQFRIFYSHDLVTWFPVMGIETATGNRVTWKDEGPPGTMSHPSTVPKRFYRYEKLPGMMPPP
jgi:hypothetical protein